MSNSSACVSFAFKIRSWLDNVFIQADIRPFRTRAGAYCDSRDDYSLLFSGASGESLLFMVAREFYSSTLRPTVAGKI